MSELIRQTGNSFQWKIRSFNTLTGSINSDRFKINGCDKIDWYLHCRLRNERIHTNNWGQTLDADRFYLVRDYHHQQSTGNSCQLGVLVDYRFSVVAENFADPTSNFYPNKMKGNGIDYLKSVRIIRRSNDRPQQLDLLVYFSVSTIDIIKQSDWSADVWSTLAPAMTTFLSEGQFADVTIVIDDQQLKANKMLLALHSPVFKSMFSQEMVEKQTNTVEIKDISADVFKAFLHYIYLGPFNEITEFCDQLIQVADKYQVEVLKKYCEEQLIKTITKDNCLELLEIADLSRSKKLVEVVIDYLNRNRNAWQQIDCFDDFFKKNPDLMLMLLKAVAKN